MQTRDGMDFLNEVLGKGKVRLEVAGVLGQGERVWVLARIEGGQLPIIGDDVIEKFLLFALGHDGQFNFIAMFTPVRVVCQNTLTAAMDKAKVDEVIKIRHTGDVQAKLKLAANLLRNAGVFFTEVAESYRYLATKQVDTKVLLSYMMEVCEQSVPFESTSQKVKNRIELYQRAHETGLGSDIKGVRGTLWGAYNAVTEVVDHQLSLNKADPVKYMGFGTGRDIKRKALKTALAYADQMN
jgi:phage/plasmid-like protein (TIGR03299 family)